MAGSHACGRNFTIDRLKVGKQIWVIYVVLGQMIEEETSVAEGETVGTFVLDVVDIDLDASVDVLVPVIEEKRVLCIELGRSTTLWGTLNVIEVLRFEVLIVFLLIVRHVSTDGCAH